MNSSIFNQMPMIPDGYQSWTSSDGWFIFLRSTLLQGLSFFTIWRIIVVLLVLGNAKNIPLIWHLRIVNAFRFCCRTQRPKVQVGPSDLFKPLITTSHSPLMEIDFNMHKTNSSYFSDIDIARTHLICTLFSTGIERMRGGTAAYNPGGRPLFGLALGAVSCSFKKELKPYQAYEMWTRILSWDEKWIYIVTHFVQKGAVSPSNYSLYPEQNTKTQNTTQRGSNSGVDSIGTNDAVVATALSKCVFKQGRRTVSPSLILRESGILFTESPKDMMVDEKESLEILSSASSDSGIEMGESREEFQLDRIEKERQRGLGVVVTLAAQGQNELEMEFTGENEALGRHTDGTGMTGVFSTLCQLAHLSKKQVL